MLALAGELADGALALLYPPEHFPAARAQVLAGAETAGRSPGSIDIPACVWVSIDEDPGAARAALADKLAFYGAAFAPYLLERVGLVPDDFRPAAAALAAGEHAEARALVTEPMLRLGIAGTPDAVVARCRALIGAGATHLSFGPPLGPDPLRAVRLLGNEVVPALRRGDSGSGAAGTPRSRTEQR
jgi:5,10-methylenetetrahydromethanopterin reductase